jgi:molybdenum cofactor synthesis domain-containing protein
MRESDLPPKTAAALVIGDEILSGKVDEANLGVLARALRELGVELRRVVVVKDDVDTIAREVRALAGTHDWVFTSGGIGPTHDDVTIEAVAKAFDVPVETSPLMEGMLRDHYKERLTEGHLRMALVPRGASLEVTEAIRWPTVRMENTWVMPGIPEVFKMKIPVIVHRLSEGGHGPAFVSLAVYTRMDEGDLKPLLDAVVAKFPDVAVGSYPKWLDAAYKTKLTFDGRDVARVRAAHDVFVATLPAGEPHSPPPESLVLSRVDAPESGGGRAGDSLESASRGSRDARGSREPRD